LRLIEKVKNIVPSTIPSTIVLLTIFLFTSCSQNGIDPVEKRLIMMDTFVTIRVYDRHLPKDKILSVIAEAETRIAEIESLTTTYQKNSEVIELNKHAGQGVQKVSPDIIKITRLAQQVSAWSSGAFDITVGPISMLWGFGRSEHMRVPPADSIQALLPHVDYHKVRVLDQGIEITDPRAGIELSGIAKGYAVDRAIETLRAAGVTDAQVDAGGDLRTLASELTIGKRHVYVRHPRDHEQFFGRFRMDEGAVATSGDYERYFIQDSVRYHHILNPATGYPARKSVSVTVKGPTTALCDALSTAVFVMGPKEGIALLERLDDIEGLIIYQENGELKYNITSGLKDSFELLTK